MKLITLTRGLFAKVSDEDFERVNQYTWHAEKDFNKDRFRAARTVRNGSYRYGISMARFILGITDPNIYVDHRNGETLDNRRENLRICSQSKNLGNQLSRRNEYKGVYYSKRNRNWQAVITVDYRRFYLGVFNSAEEAAKAYDRKAIELFGTFALTNFPLTDYALENICIIVEKLYAVSLMKKFHS